MSDDDDTSLRKLQFMSFLTGFGVCAGIIALLLLFNPDLMTKTRSGILIGIGSVLTTVGLLKGREIADKIE